MANEKHLKILRQGVKAWNRWRRGNPKIKPDLTEANLSGANLARSSLARADLRDADLSRADLGGAILAEADLGGANLSDADLSEASVAWTRLGNIDLSKVKGLDTVTHSGPSSIGIDTIYQSRGQIPKSFLRDAGVPHSFIDYMQSLVGKPFDFYSCFISYSHEDEEFTKRLHSRMRDQGLRVWYAPEDIRAGEKTHHQIDEANKLYDKLLVVLSNNSMESEWVKTEIYKARQREIKEDRRLLFPIRLVDFESIQKWQCFDADAGKDLAREIREYYIPDFKNWKNHDSFESNFKRLLKDLKARNKD